MTQRDDERLKQEFQGLRTDVRRAAPDFDSMWAEARRQADEQPVLEVVAGGVKPEAVSAARRRLRKVSAWASVAAAAAVVALVLVDRGPSGDEDFEQLVAAYSSQVGGSSWRSPTSGLMDVPGMDLTRSLPSIGAPVRGVDPSTRPSPTPSPEEENL